MKSTGIVRKVDQLGRIVTPIELRRALGVSVGDPMEIFMEDDRIILRKYKTKKTCAITGEILDDNFESEYAKGLHLSPKGAAILLEELQNVTKK
ncbi:AbrB/MazE/SpoVT family DNA-binding domain-containing protein [Planococcus maritimus]|uniref:AbrB/MazE/SpoVT family DNA-binding domain-containing protein n=1 Tax=Planococcus maritimus TaxID=192421 RepID=A0A7D7RNY5_PLAMR|nr:AbrB/MazE/SpoVT family DNA-binding domain-containing protein [Planococcus maritimus]QMT18904.1 AbrB/MazE/SpoVT family DNA-binding domain-containing protein [Planococcus maritimus]